VRSGHIPFIFFGICTEITDSAEQDRQGVSNMAKKTTASSKKKKLAGVAHPGMMGDGTEEQNLSERGNPAARIKKKEVVAAFGKPRAKK
jgi:hypothetical protein